MPSPELFFIEILGELYTSVQMQQVFADSKYFVDCIPNSNPASILHTYLEEKDKPGFDLKLFVAKNFTWPAEIVTGYSSGNKPLVQHLHDLWNVLSRTPAKKTEGTLIPLPFPYIVPGGRFREVYYWDSYFTMLGLQVSGHVDIMQNMVDNFAYLLDEIGFIPNANRTYYLGRSQPPFFTLMVRLLAEEKGSPTLLKYRRQLEKEYAFWMEGEEKCSAAHTSHRRVVYLPDGSILNRYWDDNDTPRPEAFIEDCELAGKAGGSAALVYRHIRAAAESGWDFSSRWFKDGSQMASIQTTHLVPVDLNCLLLFTEETLLTIYALEKEEGLQLAFSQKIARRKNAIQQYCYNESSGYYFDYNFMEQTQSEWCTLAGVYPLFFGLANQAQAAAVAQIIADKFLQQGGLLTTLNPTGQQWDAPNGWAPLHWMVYKGVKNYGHLQLATNIKNRWMAVNEKVYADTGKMMEKYNVTNTATRAGGGEYPNQDGFGWTNGVYLKLQQEE
jgi:alpha,alpha-trehalase